MYLEAMEGILEGSEKIIMSRDINKSTIPYLPLKQLRSGDINAK